MGRSPFCLLLNAGDGVGRVGSTLLGSVLRLWDIGPVKVTGSGRFILWLDLVLAR